MNHGLEAMRERARRPTASDFLFRGQKKRDKNLPRRRFMVGGRVAAGLYQ
jgi:hypothetical protein